MVAGPMGSWTLWDYAGDDSDVFRSEGNSRVIVNYYDATGPVLVDLVRGRVTGQGNDRLVGIHSVAGSRFADEISAMPGTTP